jgi:hypothetical protein
VAATVNTRGVSIHYVAPIISTILKSFIGLDIGGANLKAADGRGWAHSVPFALWRDPGGLAGALTDLVSTAPTAERFAVTMTGELCDVFRTKADGVRHILSTVEAMAGSRDVRVYLVDGRFVSVDEARREPHLVAASNWHALARFACRYLDGQSGLLIDVGSTTTDIVPLVDGRPCPRGSDDTTRLLSGELVYTGVGRTPICAITRSLPWRGALCPVAAELFATTADAYVLLGQLPEVPDATWTADGRPLTAEFARERFARMICGDGTQFALEDAVAAAEHVKTQQLAQLRDAVGRVTATIATEAMGVILSGEGAFLAQEAVGGLRHQSQMVSLAAELGAGASRAAPAHALAVLGQEAGW